MAEVPVPDHIDKSKFNKTLDIVALRVRSEKVQSILQHHRPALWHMPKRRPVVSCPDGDIYHKLVLFKEEIPEALLSLGQQIFYQLHLSYEDYSFDDVMRKLIPAPLEPPSSFESIGHIAHFNLKEDVWRYRFLVGQAMLDKFPQYRTIVSKIGTLNTPFRTFSMEVLAGDHDFAATVKEGGLSITVPFDRVYWNSRLSGERERLLARFNSGDIVFDLFAGVGALACLAAKKGCIVYANDLNPDATKAMAANAVKNKIRFDFRNGDARDAATEWMRVLEEGEISGVSPGNNIHFIMNLPEIAIDFLDVFRGLLRHEHPEKKLIVHCHCFAKSTPPEIELVPRVAKAMGIEGAATVEDLLGSDIIKKFTVIPVRDVAPNKMMYCIEIELAKDGMLCSKRRRV